MKTWSDEEVEIMNRFFPIRTNEEMQEMLPAKSYRSITVKANRLGLKKTPELRSLMQQGDNNHFAGKKHSEDTKERMKEVWDERKSDPNWEHCWVGRKHSDEARERMSQNARNNPNHYEHFKLGMILTEEWKEKLRKPHNMSPEGSQALRDSVMSRPGGGYGNWQEYERKDGDRVWLQSSYEVRFAQACDNHNLDWSRNTEITVGWIDKNGKEHVFYPDFTVIKDDTLYIIETKGEHLVPLDDTIRKCQAGEAKWGDTFLVVGDDGLVNLEDTGWFW